MRLNQFIAQAAGVGRRKADQLIAAGQIKVNDQPALIGQNVELTDAITLDETLLQLPQNQTVMLNKPVGYVCSRDGQGSQTIYNLLPAQLHNLKPVGRLDKDSSGLLLLTNDGELAHQLTHPRFEKEKMYHIELDKPLSVPDQQAIENGVKLEDGISKLALESDGSKWIVQMHEGRNRQIRRTFGALGYRVTRLHRVTFGTYRLGQLRSGQYTSVD